MTFSTNSDRFAAPGPLGTTNLRAALASARAAEVESANATKNEAHVAAVSQFVAPECAVASAPVTPKHVVEPVENPLLETACPSGLVLGSQIHTPKGLVSVEVLEVGDQVLTVDGAPATVQWVGRCHVPATGSLAPITFAPGMLGNTTPLTVSPMQRVLVSGPSVEKISGTHEALIAAYALVDGESIQRVEGGTVTYVMVMLEEHQLIWAESAQVETFFPDLDALLALPPNLVSRFCQSFPTIAETPEMYGPQVRPILHQLEDVAREI